MNVSLDATLSATFDRDMDASSIDTSSFLVTCSETPVSGNVTYSPEQTQANFSPIDGLPENADCEVRLTTAVKDNNGIPLLSDYVWFFSTEGVPPRVVSTSPADGAGAGPAKRWTSTAPGPWAFRPPSAPLA